MAEMYRVRTVMTGVPGTPWYSNLYLSSAGGTAADAHAAVAVLWNGLKNAIVTGVDITVEGEVAVLESVTGDLVSSVNVTPVTYASADTSTPLPTSNQVLVRLRTQAIVAGKRIAGRFYLPYQGQTGAIAGRPGPATIDFVQDAFSDYINLGGSSPVVWSRKNGTIHAILAADVWSEYGVLRSRRD